MAIKPHGKLPKKPKPQKPGLPMAGPRITPQAARIEINRAKAELREIRGRTQGGISATGMEIIRIGDLSARIRGLRKIIDETQ